MTRAYLDLSGLAPVDRRVVAAMMAALEDGLGNPSALHEPGRRARAALDEARARVARLVGGRPDGVIFTSGATEAINLAVLGVAARAAGRHVVTSAVEHIAVLNACRALIKRGWDVTLVPVGRDGRIVPEAVASALRTDTALVSVGAANGEIGTLQPVREIGALVRRRGVPLHVDGVHAVGRVPLSVTDDAIDLLSVSSNDLHGPPGTGVLWVGRDVKLAPVLLGGGQENGYRSGTQNLPGIVGMGVAADIACVERDREVRRIERLRDRLLAGLRAQVPGVRLTGPEPPARLPHHASVVIGGVKAEAVLLELDLHGIAASSGSACATLTGEPSHVLRAIGLPSEDAEASLVFTLGRWTTGAEIDHALAAVATAVERLRRLAGR
ncbi:MAG: cysteine desulfurase [Candidatus Rokubacteria bacterium]|nr:cysteine desulfurase [Candidatus Rokubacteria bacterium]